jgi:uncharacterized protein (DUF1501 family)
MAITRRQFIKRTSLATAGTLFGPSFFGDPFVRRAMASTIGTRYLILFFLDGGNDGLNTVIPVTNGTSGTLRNAYENARGAGGGGLRLTPGDLALSGIGSDFQTGATLALHPGFRGFQGFDGITAGNGGFKAIFDAGELAVIQGCGYPTYSLSHEESRFIWQTANPLGIPALLGKGWAGRALTAGGYTGDDIPAVAIESTVPLDYSGSSTSVLAINRLEDFDFPYDYDYPGDETAKRTAFHSLYTMAKAPSDPQALLRYVGSSGFATLLSAESYPDLHDDYVGNVARQVYDQLYDEIGRSTANSLREIAKVIYGVERNVDNIDAHFFELSNGGYDTHSDQGAAVQDGQHYQLHAEVAAAVKVFRDDLRNMGQVLHGNPDAIWHRTTILVWSEFSRRIPQNDNGTDHGSQGPMFVIGGKVRGGVYGNHPNVNESAWDDEGNTVYHHTGDDHDSTDFRDVYGTILKHWVNVPPATVASILPTDTVPPGGDPDEYWTTANFDLTLPANPPNPTLTLFKP